MADFAAQSIIGDGVLRNVMHVLLFETSPPSVSSVPPPSGYPVENAACAATLVSSFIVHYIVPNNDHW